MFLCSRQKQSKNCRVLKHAYEFRPTDAEQCAKKRAVYDKLLTQMNQQLRDDESIYDTVQELGKVRCKMCWDCRQELKKSQFNETSATGKCYHYIRNLQQTSQCIDCGETRHIEFDHVDPTQKIYKVTDYVYWASHGSVEALKQEVAKCVPRCRACHWNQPTTIVNQIKYNTIEDVEEEMSKVNAISQQEKKSKKIKKWVLKKVVRVRQFMKEFKMSYNQCEECRKMLTDLNVHAFDFAHIDSTTKKFSISTVVQKYARRLPYDKVVEMVKRRSCKVSFVMS